MSAVLGVAAVLVVAGCASPARTAVGSPPTMPPASSASPKPGVSASPTSAQNRATATADAQRILGTFRPPSGASRLAQPPKGVLTEGALGVGNSEYQVDDIQFWSVSGGSAKTILSHIARPAGTHDDGSAGGDTPDGGMQYAVAYAWPPIPGVLLDRTLEVTAASHDGRTIIRVDALAMWQPARDPATYVPATATSLTITYQPTLLTGPKPPVQGPVTVSDPASVAAITKLVNAAQVWAYGVVPCPNDLGERMTVVFHAGAGGPIVATATISPAGCSTVALTVGAGPAVGLTRGRDMATAIGKIIGKPWPSGS